MARSFRYQALALADTCVRMLSVRAPSLAARFAAFIWFTPPRHPPGHERDRLCRQSVTKRVRVGGHRIVVRNWGQKNTGPHLWFVHGWAGRWDQFAHLIDAMLALDYRVSAFDFPAHGETPGLSTDLRVWIDLLGEIASDPASPSPIVIAHSFGFVAAANSFIDDRLKARAVIAINPPTRFRFYVESFSKKIRLSPRVEPYLARIVERRVKGVRRLCDIDTVTLASRIPFLYVADQSDREVPFAEHYAAQMELGDAFVATKGFGHNRLLRAPLLADTIHRFCLSMSASTGA